MGMITDHVSVYVFVCVRGIENGTALQQYRQQEDSRLRKMTK